MFKVRLRRSHTFHLQFEADNLGAEIRVESSVGMLRLGLSEDGLDHDLLFFSVVCEFSLQLLLLEPLLVKTLPVSEK